MSKELDPEDEGWCDERRAEVVEYLLLQGVAHGGVGDWPAWHVAPYVSVWAIESLKAPGRVGWWAICGDLPTDYISFTDAVSPRAALCALAARWSELVLYMERGEEHPTVTIGTLADWPTLAPLLASRAELLTQFSEDESLWS